MTEHNRRITEGGNLGEEFWSELDNAFDRGEDLKCWLRDRNLSDDVIVSILAVYPNVPRRDSSNQI